MLTSQFDYKAPTTVKELFNDLHAHPNAAILSGGHSLVSLLKTGAITPDVIISTDKIKSFKEIKEESDGSVLIGSSVPLSALLDHCSIGQGFQPLVKRLRILVIVNTVIKQVLAMNSPIKESPLECWQFCSAMEQNFTTPRGAKQSRS